MSGGHWIALAAVMIPILAIIVRAAGRLQQYDLIAARRDADLRRRFRGLDEVERRVTDIERYVTSPEFQLNRQIGNLAEKA